MNRAGGLISAARLKANLTQARLAELAGTTQPTISAYERGTKVPDLATLERVLAAAGFGLRMSLAVLDDHDSSLSATSGRYPLRPGRGLRNSSASEQRRLPVADTEPGPLTDEAAAAIVQNAPHTPGRVRCHRRFRGSASRRSWTGSHLRHRRSPTAIGPTSSVSLKP